MDDVSIVLGLPLKGRRNSALMKNWAENLILQTAPYAKESGFMMGFAKVSTEKLDKLAPALIAEPMQMPPPVFRAGVRSASGG